MVRKGRENYLCLLNLEDASPRAPPFRRAAGGARARRPLGGGDPRRRHDRRRLPGLARRPARPAATLNLADRRGECIHAACPHYRKCFVESTIRRARRADIVVANHALVMVQAARGGDDGRSRCATSSTRATTCSTPPTPPFRRRSPGARRPSCAAGCAAPRRPAAAPAGPARAARRPVADDRAASAALDEAVRRRRASCPAPGWRTPARREACRPAPAEAFLALVRQQVLARSPRRRCRAYGLEPPSARRCRDCSRRPSAEAALARLDAPLRRWRRRPGGSSTRRRRASTPPPGSGSRAAAAASSGAPSRPAALALDAALAGDARRRADFVDWFAIDRIEGREVDAAFRRHWLDPTAALRRRGPRRRTARPSPRRRCATAPATTRPTGRPPRRAPGCAPGVAAAALRRRLALRLRQAHPRLRRHRRRPRRPGQVAAAMRELFLAAGGGGLGLFTAIRRLRAVHDRIAAELAAAGLRSTPSTSTPWTSARWSTSSAPRRTPACSAPTPCATASTCPAAPCACWSSTGCPGPGPTSCTARGARPSAARPTTRCWPGPAAPGLRPADPPRRRQGRVRHARPAVAEPAARRLSAGRAGQPRRPERGRGADAGAARIVTAER